jgi:AcrR family transcriptional regulator
MKKGEQTRERIIEQTAPLFNEMGYFGSSLSDIMTVTGLKKGGIYNHFESKEDLALQAFEYASGRISKRIVEILTERHTAIDKLKSWGVLFTRNYTEPPISGGCPLMNTAVESDDAHPALRERVQEAMDRFRGRITRIVAAGIESGELRSDVDGEVVATILISTLEGGLMMTRLYRDRVHVDRAVDFTNRYIDSLAA